MNFSSNLRLFITYFFILVAVTSWVVTVFWTDLVFEAKIKETEVLSNNIFLDDKDLSSTYIFYTSPIDLSNYSLKSSCNISSKYSWNIWDKYTFKITYLDDCFYWLTHLQNPEGVILKSSKLKLNVYNRSKLFDFYVDRDYNSLNKIKSNIDSNILKLEKQNLEYSFIKVQSKRKIHELEYHKRFLENILISRNQKYLVPVYWYKLPTKSSKVPNALRPYRQLYTDWIHHSWDIDTPLWEEVISLDYGKIVRIVNDWQWSDFSKLKYTDLSYDDKINNLDILRWNQIWLKTSKWDVVFYGHMKDVYDFKEWQIIDRWQKLWTIWISWVPDKNYKDYHLDFSIQKNPYSKDKVWKYSFMDYMKWDWYFKGESLDYILENQYNIFK